MEKNLLFLLLLLLSSCLCFEEPLNCTTSSSVICIGSCSECHYALLQDGLSAATPGDTVLITAGSYSEYTVTWNVPIGVDGSNRIEVRVYGDDDVVIDMGSKVFTIDGAWYSFHRGNGSLMFEMGKGNSGTFHFINDQNIDGEANVGPFLIKTYKYAQTSFIDHVHFGNSNFNTGVLNVDGVIIDGTDNLYRSVHAYYENDLNSIGDNGIINVKNCEFHHPAGHRFSGRKMLFERNFFSKVRSYGPAWCNCGMYFIENVNDMIFQNNIFKGKSNLFFANSLFGTNVEANVTNVIFQNNVVDCDYTGIYFLKLSSYSRNVSIQNNIFTGTCITSNSLILIENDHVDSILLRENFVSSGDELTCHYQVSCYDNNISIDSFPFHGDFYDGDTIPIPYYFPFKASYGKYYPAISPTHDWLDTLFDTNEYQRGALAYCGNYDPTSGCTECYDGWNISTDCTKCFKNFDEETFCTECITEYWYGSDCLSCLPVYNDDCSSCLYPYLNPGNNCSTCIETRVDFYNLSSNCEECICCNRNLSNDCHCNQNYNSSNECITCNKNYNISDDCRTCNNQFLIEDDCLVCKDNYVEEDGCKVCRNHFDIKYDCDRCLYEWDGDDCDVCSVNRNISTNCTTCNGNWNISTNCQLCNNYWEIGGGIYADCALCPSLINEDDDCNSCNEAFRDINDECKSCIGNRNELDDCQSCKNYYTDLENDCNSCPQAYTLISGCLKCSEGYTYVDNECKKDQLLSLLNDDGVLLYVSIVIIMIMILFVVIFIIVIYIVKKMKKIQKEEVLLMETILGDDDGDDSKVKFIVDKDLFLIDYKDIDLKKIIGSGSGGNIYLGVWEGKEVAIKIYQFKQFDTQLRFESFERESQLMSSLNHPNILRFYGCSTKPPNICLVLEYCKHGDIEKWMFGSGLNGKEFSFYSKINILRGICYGMSYLSKKGIIHRDLKLTNVLLDDLHTPKITDFGCSRIVKEFEIAKKTRNVGTTYYMAPEIFLGQNYDGSIDIFSMSIFIWIIMNEDSYPYGELADTSSIDYKVANDGNYRPFVDKVKFENNEMLMALVKKMWKMDPNERPSWEKICDTFDLIKKRLSF